MRIKPEHIMQMYFCCWESADETARYLGVHRATVFRWVKRAKTLSGWHRTATLKRKSTRPRTIQTVLTAQEEHRIVQLRKEKGYCAVKLKHELSLTAHQNTVHRYLRKKQLVNEYGNHRRPHYQKTTHMHLKNVPGIGYLQMDVKYMTPELTGLPWTCFEYAVIDIKSRYKEAVILNHLNEDGAILALLEILNKLPFSPVFLQNDNGLEFQKRFVKHVEAKGLSHHYIHKSTPNENAVIERSFRTDEEEFFFLRYKGATDYDDLKIQFAAYIKEYNEERPHLGIDLKTPLQVIRNHLSHMS